MKQKKAKKVPAKKDRREPRVGDIYQDNDPRSQKRRVTVEGFTFDQVKGAMAACRTDAGRQTYIQTWRLGTAASTGYTLVSPGSGKAAP